MPNSRSFLAEPPELQQCSPALASLLFLHGGSAVCVYDDQDRLICWNDRYLEFFPEIRAVARAGLSYAETVRPFLAIQHPRASDTDMAASIASALWRHRNDEGPLQFQRGDDGRWFELRMFPQPDGGRVKLWRDISADRAPGTDGSQLLGLMTVANVGLTFHDAAGQLRYMNSRFFSENFLRLIARIPAIHVRQRRSDYWREFREVFDGDRSYAALVVDERLGPNEAPLVLRARTGRSFRIEEQSWQDGIVSIWTDVTEIIEREEALKAAHAELTSLNERLRDIAERDALTGLPNRRHFDAALAQAQALVAEGTACVVGVLDLDHFKSVNDRYGHNAGDAVLVEAAARMQGALKRGDLLARLGGEEFGILFRASTLSEAWAAADVVRRALSERPFSVRADAVELTGSIGLAPLTAVRDMTSTLQRADVALYEAKSAGRDQVRQDAHKPEPVDGAVLDAAGSPRGAAALRPVPSTAVQEDRDVDAYGLEAKYQSGRGEHPVFGRAAWERARAALETYDAYWGWVNYQVALALSE